MSEVLKFRLNTTEELHLAYGSGRPCAGNRILYTLKDGRIAFVDPPLDAQIQALGPQSGSRLSITKRAGDQWQVTLHPPTEQPGPAALPAPATQPAEVVDTGNPNTNGKTKAALIAELGGVLAGAGRIPDAPYSHTGWAAFLRDQATSLIDVAASCHRYAAEKYPGMLRNEDVSDLVTTAFINLSKNGGTR